MGFNDRSEYPIGFDSGSGGSPIVISDVPGQRVKVSSIWSSTNTEVIVSNHDGGTEYFRLPGPSQKDLPFPGFEVDDGLRVELQGGGSSGVAVSYWK